MSWEEMQAQIRSTTGIIIPQREQKPGTTWKGESSVMSDSFQTMDCSPPGSAVHGIIQARILEGVAIFSSRGSSRD